MNEIWKTWRERKTQTIEVSNLGRVKIDNKLVELPLSRGYKTFGSNNTLHRIVAKLFIPNPENKPCVDHIDTDKLNNCVDNLRWVTHKENSNNPLTRKHVSEAVKKEWEHPTTAMLNAQSERGKKGKGKKRSIETKNRISNAQLGKTLKQETKERISESLKGRKLTNEHKNNLSKVTKNTVWINNGKINKRIFIEDKINYPDFVFGKIKKCNITQ